MKDSTRAERRQQELNKKNKIKRIMKEVWLANSSGITTKDDRQIYMMTPENIGKIASAPHSCRSLCCRNPRRTRKGDGRLTIQELRHK